MKSYKNMLKNTLYAGMILTGMNLYGQKVDPVFKSIPSSATRLAVTSQSVDINNDGELDLVLSTIDQNSNYKGYAYVLLNNGKGGFESPIKVGPIQLSNGHPPSVTVGDYNKDSYPDIILIGAADNYNNEIQGHFYENDGTGTKFTKKDNFQQKTNTLADKL